jgi:Domain of unknown function (DUF4126)
MNPIETIGLALGAGFSSGLNLYATVATLGLLQRFGVLRLPPGLLARMVRRGAPYYGIKASSRNNDPRGD